jgi:hypothetical protein
MASIQFPSVQHVPLKSFADASAEWEQVDALRANKQLREMQMQRMQQEQGRADQLRGLYANGQRPTAEQLYSVDPEMGMQYEKQQADNQAAQSNALLKQLPILKDIATQVRNKAQGLNPNDPSFQQQLDAIAGPYRPYIAQLTGKPDDGGPTDWNAINALADFQPQASVEYHPPLRGVDGVRQFNNGKWELIKDESGNPVIAAPDSPYLQGDIAFQKSRNTIDKVTGADQRETFMTKGKAAGYGDNQKRRASDNVPQMGVEDANLLMMQAREDNPDVTGRDKARAVLESLAAQSGGGVPYDEPIKGPTPAEVESSKDMAKNDADRAKKKQERLSAVGNLYSLLSKKVDDEEIEDIIRKSTGSGIGAKADNLAEEFGMTTSGAINISKLGPVQEWATSLVPRMEGPQSNFDVDRYKAMAGDIANPKITVEKRLQAFKTLKGMLKEFLDSGGEAQQIDQNNSKPAGEMPTFTSPNDVRGALKAGLINKEQARRVLVDQFNFEDE